jgi:hypothetical protein
MMQPPDSSTLGSTLAKSVVADQQSQVAEILASYQRQVESLEILNASWTQTQTKASEVRSQAKSKIKLNIGGKDFATSKATLCGRFPMSLLSVMISTDVWVPSDGVYFFDRDSRLFEIVLDYLRDGELHISSLITKEEYEELKNELRFYNIPFDEDDVTGGP